MTHCQWTVPVGEWRGETAFVVGGGDSVSELDLGKLAGRRVVAINSSCFAVPRADYLIFGDPRWWGAHQKDPTIRSFAGRKVAVCHAPGDGVLTLNRRPPPGLSDDPSMLTIQRTTMTAAINLLTMLGVTGIGLLGLDGKRSARGRTHHHAGYKFRHNDRGWERHALDLDTLVEPLRLLSVEVYNCCADSAHKMFPHASFDDLLARWAR